MFLKKLLTPAGKTNNLYKLTNYEYNKLLTEKILTMRTKYLPYEPGILLITKQRLSRKI